MRNKRMFGTLGIIGLETVILDLYFSNITLDYNADKALSYLIEYKETKNIKCLENAIKSIENIAEITEANKTYIDTLNLSKES